MTTIRNSPFPQVPLQQGQVGTSRDDQAAKSAAARAFFAAAMGQTQAAAAPVAASAPQAAAPVQRMAATNPAEPPQKILRPGSLLDIRI